MHMTFDDCLKILPKQDIFGLGKVQMVISSHNVMRFCTAQVSSRSLCLDPEFILDVHIREASVYSVRTSHLATSLQTKSENRKIMLFLLAANVACYNTP